VAVHYALSQWDRLVVYLEHGEMTPDNNQAENAIRPFVVGRNYAHFVIMQTCLSTNIVVPSACWA
jgi:hypothetical protein